MSTDPSGFQTSATTPEDYYRDLTNFALSQYALQGLVPASVGVSKPMSDQPTSDAMGFMNTIGSWFQQQRGVQGGASTDTIDTPVAGTYRERRYQWLSAEEGVRGWAYDDKTGKQLVPGEQPQGNRTVGVGFNLDAAGADQRFSQALPGVDYNAVKEGRYKLSPAQSSQLFDGSVQEYEGMVAKATQGMDIPEHQRLALVSLAYNSPKALQPVVDALKSDGPSSAIQALLTAPGTQGRRLREASLFSGPVDAPQAVPTVPAVGADSDIVGSANFAKRSGLFGDPRTPGWAEQNLTTIGSPDGAQFTVHKLAATAFEGFLTDLAQSGYKVDPAQSSSYALRNIRGGSSLSEHAFGNAIDINSLGNPMGKQLTTDLPRNVSQMAAKWGLTWGGDWHHRKDAMHFEWTGKTPALLASK